MEKNINEITSLSVTIAALLAVISIVYRSWRNGISPMPSSAIVRRTVIQELKRLPNHGILVEAGSGWGTLALQAGRSFPHRRIIGIENSLIPMWISFIAQKIENRVNVSFIRGDLYTYCYANVDTVVCYLYPGAMKRLRAVFYAQLAPGSYVISVCFALPDWEPERVIECRDMYRTKVYVYKA